jgi:hypothetical protein
MLIATQHKNYQLLLIWMKESKAQDLYRLQLNQM